MSASDPNSAIYVTDSAEDIVYKINRYAFSGGGKTAEEHRKRGANLNTYIPFKYLQFFLDDDAELEHIKEEYGSGRMLSSEIKKRLIEARAAVTGEMVDAFIYVSTSMLLQLDG